MCRPGIGMEVTWTSHWVIAYSVRRARARVDCIGRAVQRIDPNQPCVIWMRVGGGRHGCHPAHRYLALLVPIGELDHVPLVILRGDRTGQNQQLTAGGQHSRRVPFEGGRVAEAQPVGHNCRSRCRNSDGSGHSSARSGASAPGRALPSGPQLATELTQASAAPSQMGWLHPLPVSLARAA